MKSIIPVDPLERWCALSVRERRKRLGIKDQSEIYTSPKRYGCEPPAKRATEDHLSSTYGLTLEEWERMFLNQGSRCAICKAVKPGTSRGWATDHCHSGGQVRGILCLKCNTGLGHFQDNIEFLRAAIAYLEESSNAD